MPRRLAPKPAPSLWALLNEQAMAMQLLADEAFDGVRSPSHYDELEQRGQAIARAIPAAFRRSQ